MTRPVIQSSRPFFTEGDREQVAAAVKDALSDGILTQGRRVTDFEDAFADSVGCKYTVATNSGTSALEILLRYFDVENHEVIVPTNTFVATANAVLFAGGRPVLADISRDTLCLAAAEIERLATPKTRGVVLVHIAGLITPELEEIRTLCRRLGLFLIEDAAHAAGAAQGGVRAGNLADGGAFSFYPTKILTTGEGGMVTTNNEDCAQLGRSLRCHGLGAQGKNQFVRLGHNWRMSEIQAILGAVQLRRLEESLQRRAEIAAHYRDALGELEAVTLFPCPDDCRHSYYKFPVMVSEPHDLPTLQQALRTDFGIQIGSIYWPPVHMQPYYQSQFGYRTGQFPIAEQILNRTLALPIFPDMSGDQVIQVVAALEQCLRIEIPNRPKAKE